MSTFGGDLKIRRITWPVDAASLDTAVRDVIRLQSMNQLSAREPGAVKNGFLVTLFKSEELTKYLRDYAGSLYLAYAPSGEAVGFTLFTDMAEFIDQLNTSGSSVQWRKQKDLSAYRYLYQIAVDPNYQHQGVASALIRAALPSEGPRILSDVLTAPMSNDACLGLFARHEFERIGDLTMAAYRDFGSLKSAVLTRDA